LYALVSNTSQRTFSTEAGGRRERRAAPASLIRLMIRNSKLAAAGDDAGAFPVEVDNLDIAACRTAVATQAPVLRPAADRLGRTVVVIHSPGPAHELPCEARVVSLLHFGDLLRQAARGLGMSGLGARVCCALVEHGSLRLASRALGISHLTAASEIRDALRAADVHSQSALIHRLAGHWLGDSLRSDRAIALLRSAFNLTLRDARAAALRAAGYTRPEAASVLGVSRWSIEESSANVFAVLGVSKAPELTRLVADLMLSADLADALAPVRQMSA